jgi:hypothetical protein
MVVSRAERSIMLPPRFAPEPGDPGSIFPPAITNRAAGRNHCPVRLWALRELRARGSRIELGISSRAGHSSTLERAYGNYTEKM